MASEEGLSRHNVILHTGDLEELQRRHPRQASLVIRTLVRKFLKDPMPQPEIEVDLDD